ncbi:MAG: hypothetical protein DPW09_36145 [Anaerolineae bacterium]|nr:hypothetical protein [Anaerolineales bacterium]MCQ3978886.1 hypothetical protein [Anaerolineae bacterium]
MSEFQPRYQIGDALYFRYVPYDFINPHTGELIVQTPEIPATILSIAHNFNHDIEIGPGCYLPRAPRTDWVGFFYFVQIDQEEAAALELALTYPKGSPLTVEVIKENQITGERIVF